MQSPPSTVPADPGDSSGGDRSTSAPSGAQPGWLRVLMVLLAVPNLATGLWAVTAPRNWYDSFPGWAPELIAAFPPFNEHLAVDAGSGLLASGVVMLLAALWAQRSVVITAAVAYLAFAVPHFGWHAANPSDALTGIEDTTNNMTLVAAVIGAGVVLLWQWHPALRGRTAVGGGSGTIESPATEGERA